MKKQCCGSESFDGFLAMLMFSFLAIMGIVLVGLAVLSDNTEKEINASQACIDKGGIPIAGRWTTDKRIERCDFPPKTI